MYSIQFHPILVEMLERASRRQMYSMLHQANAEVQDEIHIDW